MQAILRAFCAKIRTFARKNEREPSRTAPSFFRLLRHSLPACGGAALPEHVLSYIVDREKNTALAELALPYCGVRLDRKGPVISARVQDREYPSPIERVDSRRRIVDISAVGDVASLDVHMREAVRPSG